MQPRTAIKSAVLRVASGNIDGHAVLCGYEAAAVDATEAACPGEVGR